jgi:hypothetical protein
MTCEIIIALSCCRYRGDNLTKHRRQKAMHTVPLSKQFICYLCGVIGPAETDFEDFEAIISANTKPYAKRPKVHESGHGWG